MDTLPNQIDIEVSRLDRQAAEHKLSPGRWSLYEETQKGTKVLCIKRSIYDPLNRKLTNQRLRSHLYRHLRSDPVQLQRLVTALNYRRDVEAASKKQYEIKSSFISQEDSELFLRRLSLGKEPSTVKDLTGYFYRHFIYALTPLEPDPVKWATERVELAWAEYLVQEQGLSESTCRRIVALGNQFLTFLHRQHPDTIRLVKMQVFPKGMFNKRRAAARRGEIRNFIEYPEVRRVLERIDPKFRPYIELCAFFGLRRNEALALINNLGAVEFDGLRIDVQMKSGEIDETKGRDGRLVPYWFATREATLELVKQLEPVNEDSLSKAFSKAHGSLPLHSLRHTFATTAQARRKSIFEVQLALGHSDPRTTAKYTRIHEKLRSSRRLEEVCMPLVETKVGDSELVHGA
jgi:integrase